MGITVRTRSFWLGLGTAVLVLGVTGLAWACGPQADMRVQPTSGPAGSEATVQGAGFPENAPVEVRWEAINGQLLGTAQGPDFSMAVTIPEVGEGTYTIVARPVGEAAYDRPTASAAFTVTAPARTSQGDTTAPSGEAQQGAEGDQATTEESQPATGDPAATQEEAPAPEEEAAPATAEESQPADTATSEESATREQPPATADETTAGDQPAEGSATDTGEGTAPAEEPGASQADEGTADTGEVTADEAAAADRYFEGSLPPARPPARAAQSDLWSGLKAEEGAGGGTALREETAGARPDQSLQAGLLLVGLGSAALLGGFLVAQARRRRVSTVAADAERGSGD